jgi:hypothetical protein
MKKSVFLKSLICLVVLIFVAKFSMAGAHDPKSSNELKQILNEQIKYPQDAQENLLEGFAVVAFNVNPAGKIVVEQISASSPSFHDYIQNKLEEVVVHDPGKYEGQTIYYRFDFKLINNY